MNKKIVTIVAIVAIVAVMAVMFVGCASVYQKNLERAGFEVAKMEAKEFEEEYKAIYGLLKDLKLNYIVTGANKEEGLAITVVGLDEEVTSAPLKTLIDAAGELSEDGKTIFLSLSDRAIEAAKTGILPKKK